MDGHILGPAAQAFVDALRDLYEHAGKPTYAVLIKRGGELNLTSTSLSDWRNGTSVPSARKRPALRFLVTYLAGKARARDRDYRPLSEGQFELLRAEAWRERHPDRGGRRSRSAPPPRLATPDQVGPGQQPPDAAPEVRRLGGAAPAVPMVSLTPPQPLHLREQDRRLRGREELVERLVSRLINPGDDTSSRVVLLFGPGGYGKTSIAQEIAHEVGLQAAERKIDVDLWWVNATNLLHLETSLEEVARRIVSVEEAHANLTVAEKLWRGLAGRARPWLLVVDNADPALLSVGADDLPAGTGWIRPLRAGSRGLIVLTSRDERPDAWGTWWDRQEIGRLEPGDAADVLLDYVADRAGTRAEAQSLAARLGHLPLALRLAGKHLARAAGSRYPDPRIPATFAEYARALDDDKVHHLQDDETRQDLEGVLRLSLELLQRRGIVHARPLIRLLSCLADAPIPDQLLLQPAALAGSELFAGLDTTTLSLTMEALADVGLIDLHEPGTSADPGWDGAVIERPGLAVMHPLVHYASRHFDNDVPGSAVAYIVLASTLVHSAAEDCGSPEDIRAWARLHFLAPHCTYLLPALTGNREPSLPVEVREQAASAAFAAAAYLQSRGMYEQAEAAFRVVLEVRRRLPDNRAAIVEVEGWLACTLRDQAHRVLENPESRRVQLEEAERRFRAFCAAREQLLEQVDTTGVLGRLAHGGWRTPQGLALLDLGWEDAAARPLRDVLDAHQQLAITLAYQDSESEEAKQIYQAVYEAQRRLLGDDHPDTLGARTGLAARLYFSGATDEALREFQAIYQSERQIPHLGPEHPDTLVSLGWIVSPLEELGRWDEAESAAREVYEGFLRIFGKRHHETNHRRRQLGSMLLRRGRLLIEEAARQSVEGDTDMPDPAHDSPELAPLDQALACFAEALELIDPDDEPGLYGVILHDVAEVHRAKGERDNTIARFRDAIAYKQRANNPADLCTTRITLGDFLIDSGELTEARLILDETRELLVKIADLAERGRRSHSLGRRYERLAKRGHDEAFHQSLTSYQEALDWIDPGLEPDFYGVILHDIADVHAAQGENEQAMARYREAIEHKLRDGDIGSQTTTLLAFGEFLIDKGDPAEARRILDQAKRLLAEARGMGGLAVHLFELGQAFQRLGRTGHEGAHAEAIVAFQDAAKLIDPVRDPGSHATVLKHIGDVQQAEGHLADALGSYQEAVAQMRRRKGAERSLVSLLLDLGRLSRRLGEQERTANGLESDQRFETVETDGGS
ncbi:NB-ARC domain-containing protein [Nonomuraea sp. NPDC050663]|uniref:NB-ARC domain-containing protein n=1 Tax=Nonomuraea sp. NPDC050663 TaxID=3364370 RepID=UPI0037BC4B23